ncbi:LysM domain-containing protein [Histoplasma capsulatum H143]|uniref:LysM domain-containing protein n=1 Tax=Ajellomyces capsulatus (strain H143) TaxID=544712 RepID=C6H3K7_AJECH|nr:LysM domain-containing protein [Histoplasma capsulatum H143]
MATRHHGILQSILIWMLLFLQAIASFISPIVREQLPIARKHDIQNAAPGKQMIIPLLVAKAAQSDIDEARRLVDAAIKKASVLNKARLDHPMRNRYSSTRAAKASRRDASSRDALLPPLLKITNEIAAAAALLAEVEAVAEAKDLSKPKRDYSYIDALYNRTAEKQAQPFWMEDIERKGAWPFGNDPSFKANDRPVIKAASSFIGLGVLSTNRYVENGGAGPDGNAKEWYVTTGNFYRQIRNFRIDITATSRDAYVAALHYQVAQATSLTNVDFIASTDPGTTQQAIYGGNQQFTAQRLKFNNCKTAVQIIWDWGWIWKNIEVTGSTTGFQLMSEDSVPRTGSILVLDSIFRNTETALLTFPASQEKGKGTTGITFDNVAFEAVKNAVVDNQGKVYLSGSVRKVDTWALGPVSFDMSQRDYTLGMSFSTKREPTLVTDGLTSLPKAPFFERAKPQYEAIPVSKFVHMKDRAKGDGITDDTESFQSVLLQYAGSDNIIFVDAGSYILTETITIPAGAKIVGEGWPQLVAFGPKFQDEKNPRPLVRVGNRGDRGDVEIQDLLFTTKGPTAGAVLVEWNIKAACSGCASMWDSHVRIGGATGSELTSTECPAITSGVNGDGCKSGSLMMHITDSSSAYMENVWLWTADHDIDDLDWQDNNNTLVQTSIYTARGLLVESTEATWLYGTSSEHALYYQYNFYKAQNVFAGMIQTESPYYQPTPNPPAPFESAVGIFNGDPAYQNCHCGSPGNDAAWALRIIESSEIYIAGAGLYSWFSTYTQECIKTRSCQNSLIQLEGNGGGVRIFNLITIGATNMITSDGNQFTSQDNLAVDYHPYWSQITIIDPIQKTGPQRLIKQGLHARNEDKCPPVLPEAILPEGKYPTNLSIIDIGGHSDHGYFTLVNGSPYNWILTSSHSYQMDQWKWHNVPAGESVQCEWQFAQSFNRYDDKGEAYYKIEGTDKTFQIMARYQDDPNNNFHLRVLYDGLETKDVPKGTSLDFPSRGGLGDMRAMNWVLAGSEEQGYWSSHKPPIAWMSSILTIIGERKLKHVCMPGSHDAGMSKLNGHTEFSNEGNTLTQYLNIYDQLRRGSRYFDVRPAIGDGGKFLTGHYSDIDILDIGWQGGNGESIQDIVDGINRFTAENPELIIINLDLTLDTENGYKPFNDEQWSKTFDLFEGVTHLRGGLEGDLSEKKMNDYIGNGQASVIILSSGGATRPDKGIYSTRQFPRFDSYSNTDVVSTMADDQIAKLKGNRNIVANDAERKDVFHVFSWTLTLTRVLERTIADQSIELAYDPLFWRAYHAFTPFSYPSVLYMDFIGSAEKNTKSFDQTTGEVTAMAMAVNMQLASQNCYVGGGSIVVSKKPPLEHRSEAARPHLMSSKSTLSER